MKKYIIAEGVLEYRGKGYLEEDSLVHKVNSLTEDGYVPIGSPILIPGNNCGYQAMYWFNKS